MATLLMNSCTCYFLIEDMMVSNADSLFVIGGDFNVDFSRLCRHTAILDRFCTDVGLMPADRHSRYLVEYTYQLSFV